MKKLILLLSLLSSSPALADHASWSGSRGGYQSSSLQLTNETQIIQSTTRMFDSNDIGLSKNLYKGFGLKTSLSTEVGRFVRFSTHHTYRDLSSNPADSIRGSEIGGDIKLSFWGPVVNLQLGVGLSASRLNHQSIKGSTIYFGRGYNGSLGLERFIDPKASILLSVVSQSEKLLPEQSKIKEYGESSIISFGLGLTLWLN